jgi:hypothetical protein
LSGQIVASALTQPDPNLPDAQFDYEAGASALSGGELAYELYIRGPTPTVKVLIKANSYVSGSRIAGDSEQELSSYYRLFLPGTGFKINDSVDINYGTNNSFAKTGHSYIMGSSGGGYSGGFTEDRIYTLYTNQYYRVSMGILIRSNLYTSTTGSEAGGTYIVLGGRLSDSAFLDPIYQIAPGTPNLSQYAIYLSPEVSKVGSLSPGMANAASEPSTKKGTIGLLARPVPTERANPPVASLVGPDQSSFALLNGASTHDLDAGPSSTLANHLSAYDSWSALASDPGTHSSFGLHYESERVQHIAVGSDSSVGHGPG